MRSQWHFGLKILFFAVLFSPQLVFANLCSEEFFKLGSLETVSTEIVVVNESTEIVPQAKFFDIDTTKKGFDNSTELMEFVLGNIAALLEKVPPEAQRAFLGLFGDNGLFFNNDFLITLIDSFDMNLKSEIRSISLGNEPIEADLLSRIVRAGALKFHQLYLFGDSAGVAKYYKQRGLKKAKAGLRKRGMKKFFDALPGEAEDYLGAIDETGKKYYSELIRQAVFYTLLEENFFDRSRVTNYERTVLYSAGEKEQKPTYNDMDGPGEVNYFWKPGGHSVISLLLLAGEFIIPGSSLVTIPAQQTFFKSTPLRTFIINPILRRKKQRRLNKLAASIEGRLEDGGFRVASPIAQLREDASMQPLLIGQGDRNGVHDPVQFEIPDHLVYSEDSFRSEFERVRSDEKSVERLINLTVDKFGLKMNLALAQGELEDKDFFGLWNELEVLKGHEQYRAHFKSLGKRKAAYEILKARSDYLWAQREIVVQVLSDVEDFKQLLESLLGEDDSVSLIEVIESRVSNYSGFKNDFETNSEELLEIARGILDESFEEPFRLVSENPDRGARIRLLPRHHDRSESNDLVVSENGSEVRVGVVQQIDSPTYSKFLNKKNLPSTLSGTSDTYVNPHILGFPIMIDQVDGDVLKALCFKLGELAALKGIRGHYKTKYKLWPYSGKVARVVGYNETTKKFEVAIERVRRSRKVVGSLICY